MRPPPAGRAGVSPQAPPDRSTLNVRTARGRLGKARSRGAEQDCAAHARCRTRAASRFRGAGSAGPGSAGGTERSEGRTDQGGAGPRGQGRAGQGRAGQGGQTAASRPAPCFPGGSSARRAPSASAGRPGEASSPWMSTCSGSGGTGGRAGSSMTVTASSVFFTDGGGSWLSVDSVGTAAVVCDARTWFRISRLFSSGTYCCRDCGSLIMR